MPSSQRHDRVWIKFMRTKLILLIPPELTAMSRLPEAESRRVGLRGRRDTNAEELRDAATLEVDLFEKMPENAAVVGVLE